MNNPRCVLMIGLIPELANYAAFDDLNADKVRATVNAQLEKLKALGYDAEQIYVDKGDTAEAVIAAKLAKRAYDCVLLGAGVRVPPENLHLFEKFLNVVHQRAPGARICFNSFPGDSVEAVQRWTH